MHVLTASTGSRPDDFAYGVVGELLYLGIVCLRDESGDGGCGCARAFTGVSTGKATTVAAVTDLELDRGELAALVADHLQNAGWDTADELARELADDIADTAAEHPVGTTLRRQLDEVVAQ